MLLVTSLRPDNSISIYDMDTVREVAFATVETAQSDDAMIVNVRSARTSIEDACTWTNLLIWKLDPIAKGKKLNLFFKAGNFLMYRAIGYCLPNSRLGIVV